MSLPILRRSAARADLLQIWSHIADDNEPAADRVIQRFERTFRTLSDNPHAGRARPEIADGLRSFPVKNYVVFYRAEAAHIAIVRVLSGFQDIETIDFS